MPRATIACPEAEIGCANHLAMVLGFSDADRHTYGAPVWTDQFGNLYAVASLPVSAEFIRAAQSQLQRPARDAEARIIDMGAAARAQSLVRIYARSEDDTPEQEAARISAARATPEVIQVVFHEDALAAVAMLGLTRVYVPDPVPL